MGIVRCEEERIDCIDIRVLYGSTTTSEGERSEEAELGRTEKLKMILFENSSLIFPISIEPNPEPVPPPSE